MVFFPNPEPVATDWETSPRVENAGDSPLPTPTHGDFPTSDDFVPRSHPDADLPPDSIEIPPPPEEEPPAPKPSEVPRRPPQDVFTKTARNLARL